MSDIQDVAVTAVLLLFSLGLTISLAARVRGRRALAGALTIAAVPMGVGAVMLDQAVLWQFVSMIGPGVLLVSLVAASIYASVSQ